MPAWVRISANSLPFCSVSSVAIFSAFVYYFTLDKEQDAITAIKSSWSLVAKTAHLKEKLTRLASEMQKLKAYEQAMLASPDQQISLTDPDSRSMATSGRGSGVGMGAFRGFGYDAVN